MKQRLDALDKFKSDVELEIQGIADRQQDIRADYDSLLQNQDKIRDDHEHRTLNTDKLLSDHRDRLDLLDTKGSVLRSYVEFISQDKKLKYLFGYLETQVKPSERQVFEKSFISSFVLNNKEYYDKKFTVSVRLN